MVSLERLQRMVEQVDLTKIFFTDLNGRLVSLPVNAEGSTLLCELLGAQLYTNYLALKVAEWEDYRTHVTVREHERCLRI